MPKNKKELKNKLPLSFKPLMWGYDFNKIDPELNIDRIIVNTVNYGFWEHWMWLFNYYGPKELKRTIFNIPKSEFRNYKGLNLISLILGLKKMKYETRGLKIQAERNMARA